MKRSQDVYGAKISQVGAGVAFALLAVACGGGSGGGSSNATVQQTDPTSGIAAADAASSPASDADTTKATAMAATESKPIASAPAVAIKPTVTPATTAKATATTPIQPTAPSTTSSPVVTGAVQAAPSIILPAQPPSPSPATATRPSEGNTTAAAPQQPAAATPASQNAIVQALTAPSTLQPWLPETAANTFITQSSSTRSMAITMSPVLTSDVLLNIRPSTIRQKVGLQCQGVDSDFRARTSVFVREDSGATKQRFGLAGTANQPVMRYEVGARDVVTSAPRCESYSMPTAENGFVSGDTVWNAAKFWTDDWAGTTDEQIVMQWKNFGPTESDQNPFFALIVKGGRANITVRSNDNTPAVRATNAVFVSPEFAWGGRQWNSVVVQSKISPSSTGGGFIRVWVNGVKVLDRNMAIGYRLGAGAYNYTKWGVYKWTSGNPWDTKIPVRSVMFDRVVLVKDNASRYNLNTIGKYAFE